MVVKRMQDLCPLCVISDTKEITSPLDLVGIITLFQAESYMKDEGRDVGGLGAGGWGEGGCLMSCMFQSFSLNRVQNWHLHLIF